MSKRSTLAKHVKLTGTTHKRLRKLQAEWELRTIDITIQHLLEGRG